MSKKIIVITGSPRKNGNSFAMTEAFIKAAEDKGHTVTRFDAAMKQVGGCHACETCFKTGKACSFDDDFNTIAPAILEADAVVFSTPVYWYSIPAQIKGVIDKMYSFCVAGKEIAGKECAVITCCEENDLSVMDGVRIPIERTAALLKWNMIGEVLVPGVLNAGEIEKQTDADRRLNWQRRSERKGECRYGKEDCNTEWKSQKKWEHFRSGPKVYGRRRECRECGYGILS